jgi:formamidopyrimidine-DNA glycosylase
MLELPEAVTIAAQLTETLPTRVVDGVVAGHSPHRFAFFQGDPDLYQGLLRGQSVTGARAVGGMVELHFESMSLVVNDGVRLRYHEPGAARPAKHQLLVSFADGSALSASVQMYGALLCVRPALSTTRTTPPRWPSHRR